MEKFFACYLFVIAVGLTIAKECNFKPGLDKMRKGVDITKLEWLPLNQNDDDGFRLQVIEFTCDKSKEQTSCPASPFKRAVKINGDKPDQMFIYGHPTGTLSSTTQIYKSARDYQKTMSASASIDYGGGLFSASASYKRIENSIQKNENYVQESFVHVSLFNADLHVPENLKMTSGAKTYVDNLPLMIEDGNVEKFLEFYKTFGTHYMQTAKFGGSIRFFLETKQSYYQTHTEDQVRLEVAGTVGSFTGSASFGYQASKTNSEFQKKSTKTISYFGGKTNLLSKGNGLDKWQPTVKDHPILFTGQLVPIYKLIKNRAKKEALKIALEIYLAKTQLADVKKQLKLLKLGFHYDGITAHYQVWFRDISVQLKKLEKKKMLRKKDVTDLACAIKSRIYNACRKDYKIVASVHWHRWTMDNDEMSEIQKRSFSKFCMEKLNKPFDENDY